MPENKPETHPIDQIHNPNQNIILLASTNRGKLAEMQALFDLYASGRFKLITPSNLNLTLDVLEDGVSYAENAAKKALAHSRQSGMLTLSDDSGLEVDVLEGRPGLHSARYAPHPGASDADRRAILLKELSAHPRPWNARFHCTVAIALPDGRLYFQDGHCLGEIIPQERGSNGFGYDPIFQVADTRFSCKTMAELSMGEKNKISHRALAVRGGITILEKLFSGSE